MGHEAEKDAVLYARFSIQIVEPLTIMLTQSMSVIILCVIKCFAYFL